MLGVKRGAVVLVPHNPVWAGLFEQEKELLLRTFRDQILAIEHIGSTAIPDIPAKPIIDINLGVHSLNDISVFIDKLPELGYTYIPRQRFPGQQFFPKGLDSAQTHHLKLVELTSETGWANALLFRDYLRAHPEAREAYAILKQKLADRYVDDRDEYTERKGMFVMEVIRKAREESAMKE